MKMPEAVGQKIAVQPSSLSRCDRAAAAKACGMQGSLPKQGVLLYAEIPRPPAFEKFALCCPVSDFPPQRHHGSS